MRAKNIISFSGEYLRSGKGACSSRALRRRQMATGPAVAPLLDHLVSPDTIGVKPVIFSAFTPGTHMFRAAAVAMFFVLAISTSLRAETRFALVVGNSAYQHTAALPNPINDARDVAAALKAAGFGVTEALDADKAKLDAALRTFTEKLSGADVALFFYAGHGLQLGLQNYLVPIDAKLERERDLEFEAMKLDFVLRQMEIDREGKTSIVILDACRDNPLARNLARSMGTRSTAVGRGLAAAPTGLGTFIAFSTQPGNVALDGTGRNSPFTAALVKQIGLKGRNLPATMIEVRNEVVATTDGQQVPWDHSAMTRDFYFLPADAAPGTGSIAAAPAATSDDVAALKERLRKLEEDAQRRESVLTAPTAAPSAAAQQADALKLAETRKRVLDLEELVKSLSRQREQAQSAADSTRTGSAVAIDAADRLVKIDAEIARRQADLRAVNAEVAALEGRPPPQSSAAVIPPVTPKAVQQSENAFQDSENVSLAGVQIRSFRAPSPAACRDACERDAACAGYQHGRKIPVMGTCELYAKVDTRSEDAKWRSGIRKVEAEGAVSNPLQIPGIPFRKQKGFIVYDNVAVLGEVIKSSEADTADSCIVVCRNTAKCVAANFMQLSPQSKPMCVAFAAVQSTRPHKLTGTSVYLLREGP